MLPNYLTRDQRRRLEATVKVARVHAEAGAKAALDALAVGQAEPFAHLTDGQRTLRKELRARARQLGDVRDASGSHGFARLVHAVAYEHWHRMLFARFLAERGLLLHPTGVAVTIDDCADLAREEGGRNGWELAGRYAAAMLPQVFRPDDPVLAVALPVEKQQALEQLLAGLDPAVFAGQDALGWVYQFWQAQKKQDINDAQVKIGADELPAVTQLFTEPYMVQFLLHNTLGAWWAGQVLAADEGLAGAAESEAELRAACELPGVRWDYLRFVREGEGAAARWRPAAGNFAAWPVKAKDITVLDPCCGSGHFLVALLEILTALRVHGEGLSVADACDAVLRDNLHGLELDQRCAELAAFAVALAAWSLPGAVGVRPLPELKIACSGLSLGVSREEWLKLADGQRDLVAEMEQLYFDLENAPVLGSLIQPRRVFGSLFEEGTGKLVKWLKARAMRERAAGGGDVEGRELAVTAFGAATAAEILSGQYWLVATNVPYLKKGKQKKELASIVERDFPLGAANLATAFLQRCWLACRSEGVVAAVNINDLLNLGTFLELRRHMLKSRTILGVGRAGAGAFEAITGEVVNAVLLVSGTKPCDEANSFFAIDASASESPPEKAESLRNDSVSVVGQFAQIANADSRILLVQQATHSLLANKAAFGKGSTTGDSPRFLLGFWELPEIGSPRVPWLDSPSSGPWSGRLMVCKCAVDDPSLTIQLGCRIHGQEVWGKRGVVVNKINQTAYLYAGEVFDDNVGPIAPRDQAVLPALWAYVGAADYKTALRQIDQKLNVTAATLTKVPFDLAHWTKVAADRYPNGLPPPFSSDPTQWLFSGHPYQSDRPLHVAVARLLGYRWPRQTGSSFPDCPALPPDNLEPLADTDGIVCLPAVSGERPAADRLHDLLAAAYGDTWSAATLQNLLAAEGYPDRTLHDWLETAFFEQHCRLFHHRPFIWHIWDGVRGGFSALLHYHRLDHRTLEKLTYTYLGDWISRQDHGARNGQDGAQERLAAAQALKTQLQRILAGEQPLDIFVRWKPLPQQPIGWHPDLDDGVRLNIRPFLLAADVRQRGAGILRWKPNIHWNVDRGKDVASAPWFTVFQGVRVNDHHLTLAEKRAARAAD